MRNSAKKIARSSYKKKDYQSMNQKTEKQQKIQEYKDKYYQLNKIENKYNEIKQSLKIEIENYKQQNNYIQILDDKDINLKYSHLNEKYDVDKFTQKTQQRLKNLEVKIDQQKFYNQDFQQIENLIDHLEKQDYVENQQFNLQHFNTLLQTKIKQKRKPEIYDYKSIQLNRETLEQIENQAKANQDQQKNKFQSMHKIFSKFGFNKKNVSFPIQMLRTYRTDYNFGQSPQNNSITQRQTDNEKPKQNNQFLLKRFQFKSANRKDQKSLNATPHFETLCQNQRSQKQQKNFKSLNKISKLITSIDIEKDQSQLLKNSFLQQQVQKKQIQLDLEKKAKLKNLDSLKIKKAH